MKLDSGDRLSILKIEMELIQATLDKYDDLIFRNRNWFITLWMGTIGLSFTIQSTDLPILAVVLALLYFFIEGMMRHQYWYKYVLRYRTIRSFLNSEELAWCDMQVYDLTDHFKRKDRDERKRIQKSFFKLEPSLIYASMAAAALVVRYFVSGST